METIPTQELITKLISWIESSSSFVKSEWPDFVDQFIKAALIRTWLNAAILALLVFIFISFSIWSIYYAWNWNGKSYEIPTLIVCMNPMCPVAALLVFFGLITEIHNLINIYVAPKVYILQHLKDFVK